EIVDAEQRARGEREAIRILQACHEEIGRFGDQSIETWDYGDATLIHVEIARKRHVCEVGSAARRKSEACDHAIDRRVPTRTAAAAGRSVDWVRIVLFDACTEQEAAPKDAYGDPRGP